MKKMRVGELATLYGINRQSIYKRIKKGDLSKSADGLIDFSEALRVFGEPSNRVMAVTELQQKFTEEKTESYTLKLQVEMLEKQIKKLEENEAFLKEQITTKDQSIHLLQTLLSAPKETIKSQEEPVSEAGSKALIQSEENSITETKSIDRKGRKPKKSLFGRVLNAVFDED